MLTSFGAESNSFTCFHMFSHNLAYQCLSVYHFDLLTLRVYGPCGAYMIRQHFSLEGLLLSHGPYKSLYKVTIEGALGPSPC